MAPKLEPRRHGLVAIIGARETDDEWNNALSGAARGVGGGFAPRAGGGAGRVRVPGTGGAGHADPPGGRRPA